MAHPDPKAHQNALNEIHKLLGNLRLVKPGREYIAAHVGADWQSLDVHGLRMLWGRLNAKAVEFAEMIAAAKKVQQPVMWDELGKGDKA